jgi:hypothetical protein
MEYAGAFDVWAAWTPSATRVTPNRTSYYGLATAVNNPRLMDYTLGPDQAQRIWSSVQAVTARPASKVVNGGIVNVVVAILVRSTETPTDLVSGFCSGISTTDGWLSLAIADEQIHEFGHAWPGLGDEYIHLMDTAISEADKARGIANAGNMWSRSQFAYTTKAQDVPWRHLMPGSDLNPDQGSVIGLLWWGGYFERGVWHSEPFCLMNGAHQNWNLSHTQRGAWLRASYLCFWCEELAVARIAAVCGLLGPSTDGVIMWNTWLTKRAVYDANLNVKQRIVARNASLASAGVASAVIFDRPVNISRPYVWADAATALRIGGGLAVATSANVSDLNVCGAGASLTFADALRIARKAAGLDANP